MSFVVTPRFITDGQSFRGGWTKRQLEILGFDWPPPPGWRKQAVGRRIEQAAADEFLALKAHRPAPLFDVP